MDKNLTPEKLMYHYAMAISNKKGSLKHLAIVVNQVEKLVKLKELQTTKK